MESVHSQTNIFCLGARDALTLHLLGTGRETVANKLNEVNSDGDFCQHQEGFGLRCQIEEIFAVASEPINAWGITQCKQKYNLQHMFS